MAGGSQIAVRVDEKGRVTLPKSIRDALEVTIGDTVFFRYEARNKQARVARAANPFDTLGGQAVKEHRSGRTKTVKKFTEEHNNPERVALQKLDS